MIAYLITNTVNGKRYVGISKESTPDARWKEHIKRVARGSEQLLHRAIKKYGNSAFVIEAVASADSWKNLCEVEKLLIAQYKTFVTFGVGYNMTLGGDGTLGAIKSIESRAKLGNSHRGMKRPPETGKAISKAHLAKGWKPVPAAREASRAACLGKPLKRTHKARMSVSLRAGWASNPERRIEASIRMSAARSRMTASTIQCDDQLELL